jgi:hypothetical protein
LNQTVQIFRLEAKKDLSHDHHHGLHERLTVVSLELDSASEVEKSDVSEANDENDGVGDIKHNNTRRKEDTTEGKIASDGHVQSLHRLQFLQEETLHLVSLKLIRFR